MLVFNTTEASISGVSAITKPTAKQHHQMTTRDHFRKTILTSLSIKPPAKRAEFHQEWQGGHYIMKLKKGSYANFGSRVPDSVASIGANVMDPPYVTESRNFLYNSEFMTDEFCFTEPAKAMAKVFKALSLPFHHGMSKQAVEDYMRQNIDEVSYGPNRPYRSCYTRDPNNWTRGYTPQPGDVSSSIFAYHDGLL
jgi:hypothetical protein